MTVPSMQKTTKETPLCNTHYLLIQKVTHHIQHFSFLISLQKIPDSDPM